MALLGPNKTKKKCSHVNLLWSGRAFRSTSTIMLRACCRASISLCCISNQSPHTASNPGWLISCSRCRNRRHLFYRQALPLNSQRRSSTVAYAVVAILASTRFPTPFDVPNELLSARGMYILSNTCVRAGTLRAWRTTSRWSSTRATAGARVCRTP